MPVVIPIVPVVRVTRVSRRLDEKSVSRGGIELRIHPVREGPDERSLEMPPANEEGEFTSWA